MTLRVQINGEPRDVPVGTTVLALLDLLAIKTTRVAVEVNTQVVPRVAHAATMLAAGDHIEIVTFVGGG